MVIFCKNNAGKTRIKGVLLLRSIFSQTTYVFADDVKPANCEAIVIFPNYGQFGAIWKPGSRRMVAKLTFLLKGMFNLAKTENRTRKSQTHFS